MNPDNSLVVSLATAKKLNAAGFPQNTFFCYCEILPGRWELKNRDSLRDGEYLAAPLASEVAANYPDRIWITAEHGWKIREGVFYFVKKNNKFIVTLMVNSDDKDKLYQVHRTQDVNEAEARSSMYLFIKEQLKAD